MNWFTNMLSENQGGGPSATRLALFIVVLTIVFVVVYSVVRHVLDHTPWDIGTGLSNLLSATIASLSAAKAWQKGSERPPE